MRRLSALALLLVAGLLAVVGSHPVDAAERPSEPKKPTTVSLRLAPAGSPSTPTASSSPPGSSPRSRPRQGRAHRHLPAARPARPGAPLARARTDATGRAYRPLAAPDSAGRGPTAPPSPARRTSRPRVSARQRSAANANSACSRRTRRSTARRTGEAYCLLTRLDGWQRPRPDGRRPAGQRLQQGRLAAAADRHHARRRRLRPRGARASATSRPRSPTSTPTSQGLLERAQGRRRPGRVVARRPTPSPAGPTAARGLGLRPARPTPGNAAYDAFWADWDAKLDLLARFQDGDSDGDGDDGADPASAPPSSSARCTRSTARFFWWGQPDAAHLPQAIWAEMQARAAEPRRPQHRLGLLRQPLHRPPPRTPPTTCPRQVDIGGLDTYDPETGRGNATDVLGLEGYAAIDQSPPVAADGPDRGRPAQQHGRRLEPRRHQPAPSARPGSPRCGRCSGSTTPATPRPARSRSPPCAAAGPGSRPASTPSATSADAAESALSPTRRGRVGVDPHS